MAKLKIDKAPKAIEYLSVNELEFDPDNPRLPNKLKGNNRDADVIEWMLLQENVSELMASIGQKGYFQAEPLLVVKNKKNKYEVIEGNRRLAAVKILNKPTLAKVKKNTVASIIEEAEVIPEKLPVLIFDERAEVLVYLGYRHITGVKEWSALSKARYLRDLLNLDNEIKNAKPIDKQHSVLAKIIGSNKSHVKSLLRGLIVFDEIANNDFFDIQSLDETKIEFGVLYTAVGKSNIGVFIGVDIDAKNPVSNLKVKHLKELTKWVFEEVNGVKRVPESRDLDELNSILDPKYPKALEEFRKGKSLEEAAALTDHPKVVFQNSITKINSAINIINSQIAYIELPVDDELKDIEDLLLRAKSIKDNLTGKKVDNG